MTSYKNKALYNKYLDDIKSKYNDNTSYFTDTDINTKKHIFLDKFISCEFYMKNMLYHYYHNNDKFMPIKDIKFNMNSIYACMSFYNFSFDKNILNYIFGNSYKRGEKSCNALRNGLVHYFDSNDGYEVINRFDELVNYMDMFLCLFK